MHGYQFAILLPLILYFVFSMVSSAVFAGAVVMHNGKPFFPIGIYHYPKGLPLEPKLEELAKAGFNTVLSGITSSTEFMDAAERHGIGVLATLGWQMILDPATEESKKAFLKEHIERLKDHPALLGYEAPDEIAWVDFSTLNKPGKNREGVTKGYSYIKSLDPDHPIWMNHAPRNTIEYLKSYSEGGDILGTDIYPVPEGIGHSDLDQSLNCVGQYAEKLDEVGSGKPIYMVLQGFAWEDLPPRGGRMTIQPNLVETRFMAYDAICHGANGIIYWGMAYTEIGDEIWDHLKRIASEIRDLTPVLVGSQSQSMNTADEALELHLREYEGYHYLFVLNTKKEHLPEKQIPLPDAWKGEVAAVLFENRSLDVVEGGLVDSFPPNGVHIYTDDPRPDLDVDVVNPQVLELGRMASLEVALHNRGISDAPPFNLTLSTDGGKLASTSIGGLGALSSLVIGIDWTPQNRGDFTLHVDADLEGVIDERTRTNNGEILSLTASPAGPDLRIVSAFMMSQDTICAEVANAGLQTSTPFNVSCTLGSIDLPEVSMAGLLPGETSAACWNIVEGSTGTLQMRFIADGPNGIEEMIENNNDLVETVYLEDLTSEGPVLHVKGLSEDNLWLIKYDTSLGALPREIEACTLVWGIDDWRFPERLPRRSKQVDRRCESPMEKGLDGLWYIIIPNQHAEALVFEFKDNHSNRDDNNGRGWKIVRTQSVLDLLNEYDRVVDNGTYLGADMSEYIANLSSAWAHFKAGNYTGALSLAEGYELAGVEYVKKLLEIALDDIESAKALGIDVSADERNLFIASKILEANKYVGAEKYCNLVINHLSEEMAKIPEPFNVIFLIPMLFPPGTRILKHLSCST